jgi:hypothetical protein
MSIVNFGECNLEEEKKIPLGIPPNPTPKKKRKKHQKNLDANNIIVKNLRTEHS